MSYKRPQAFVLKKRLQEQRRFIQVIAGPRQVGKTTMVRSVCADMTIPYHYASADEPTLHGRDWLISHWELARLDLRQAANNGLILALDEIQKIQGWSETVKRLWDEDSVAGRELKIILLGSSPLLLQRGLSESLAGRFELIDLAHWSFTEMRSAFGWDFDHYVYFGGYPGAAPLIGDPERWRSYLLDSLIETTISRDILLMNRVDKPALLRLLFHLGCAYSGRIVSYQKMLGQLQDAGNTTTLAHYLQLLSGAGMITGLSKFAGEVVRQRGSSPKLLALNTALISAQHGLGFDETRRHPETWGHLVETSVGAHLVNAARQLRGELFYWREGNHEVDFVLCCRDRIIAIEVKSGQSGRVHSGLAAFQAAYSPRHSLLVGPSGISIEEFITRSTEEWFEG